MKNFLLLYPLTLEDGLMRGKKAFITFVAGIMLLVHQKRVKNQNIYKQKISIQEYGFFVL